MKRVLFTSVFVIFSSCTDLTSPETKNETKEALVIGHIQDLKTSVIPDSSKDSTYRFFCVDFFYQEYQDSISTKNMTTFVNNNVNDNSLVFLSKQAINYRPVGSDIGGSVLQRVTNTTPFSFSSTKYNASDSCLVTIDSIFPDNSLHIRIADQLTSLKKGDTLIHIDTILGRTDSSFCWQQIIITQKLINFGLCQLPDNKFIPFF